MHDTSDQRCQAECLDCKLEPFTRNHYFTGKLLVERDFKDEQRYYVDKLRHHHQRLHGSGVVCGLEVTPHEDANCRKRFICVEPGTAVDCCGHDIVVRERDCIDVTKLAAYKEIAEGEEGGSYRLQVCIRYRECPTEDIPVLYDECGCDDGRCAPNRILESYGIDLRIAEEAEADDPHAPKLDWRHNVPLAHGVQAVLHEGTSRLYVLNSDGAVFPVRTDNHTVLTPVVNSDARALAVSADGKWLYIAVGAAGADRKVLVFDTTNLAGGAKHTLAIANSADSAIELAVAPVTGRLIALVCASGRVLVWKTDYSPHDDIDLSANALRSLAVGSDGTRAYAVDRAAHQILVADLTNAAKATPIPDPAGTLDLYAAAVVRSTGEDALAAVAQADNKLYLFISGEAEPKSIGLAGTPEALAISPGGNWAYVLERSGTASSIQVVNLFRLRQGRPVSPGTAYPVGAGSTSIVITESGRRLYVPWTGDPAAAGDGSVAIVDITDVDCTDVFYGDCPSCESPECIVLAAIENYHLDDRIEAQTDPPADPVKDAQEGKVRIDNRSRDRRMLPSTQALAEALECVLERGGSGIPGPQGLPGAEGKQGEKGADGLDGAPGLGFNPDLPKILDIGWKHYDTVRFDDFRRLNNYRDHPRELRDAAEPPLLAVYFSRAPVNGIDRQTFRVSIAFPQCNDPTHPSFTGMYNWNSVDLYGYLLDLGARPTPHTGENAPAAFAFVPYREFFLAMLGVSMPWWGQDVSDFDGQPLDLPVLRVTLKGDFIYTGPAFAEDSVLDADNIGGNVGQNITRSGPIKGGKNPSGDLAQGGDFESWLYLSKPEYRYQPPGHKIDVRTMPWGETGVDPNDAPIEVVALLPKVTEGVTKRILKAREVGPFTDLEDFRKRAKLTDAQFEAVRGYLRLPEPPGGNNP